MQQLWLQDRMGFPWGHSPKLRELLFSWLTHKQSGLLLWNTNVQLLNGFANQNIVALPHLNNLRHRSPP